MVVAVSDSDKVKMIKFVDNLKVRVVPNGAGEDLMNVWMKKEPQKIPIVFFQANFSWLQNIEAASTLVEKIFPLIKEKISVVQCRIVGQSAKEKVGGLGKKDIKVIDLENSDIKGVIDAYKKATVFVAPLEGPGGTRLKILGAMAAGVPIVTSQIGIEGIEAVNNQEVLVGRNWREMAEKTISLLKNKKVYDQLALNARKLVEEKYSYKSIADLLSRFYLEVSGGRN